MYKQLERIRTEKGRVRMVKYSRCSGDEQKKNGYTIEDQLVFVEHFAKENDLIVVDEYVDEGISAALEISKRKALVKLIQDAKAGKFDIVVFKCIDRFFRSVGEYYECQKQLQKAGVTWLSIEEPDLDPEDDDAAFKINIYLTMAEYEAKKTSKRIRFNNAMRVKNKQVINGQQNFSFPWIVTGGKKNRHLERNLENADMLFDLLDYFEMHQSKRGTLIYFNQKYEYTISMNSLNHLLQNTLLYGEYRGISDYVEPWITKERFDNIQELLKRNARYSKNESSTFIFSGLIKCRCCGKMLCGNTSSGKDYLVLSYRCNKNRQRGLCENSQSTSEKKIEKQLIENLDKYIQREITYVESLKEKKSVVKDNTKKIESLKKEMERLNTMFRKGRIEEEDYDKEYCALEAELKKLENVEKPEERNLDGLKALMESDYKTMYAALDAKHKKAFWRKIIREFKLDENKKIIPESIIFLQ